ncbi:uncharacterized protein LOC132315594 [Cornus florida]|uniref:uncharacterized protein LOC132315594 n=1 Tax=Cornus florida TaxID=4283 RepID=UPI00289DCE5A|nr:uncharacterized protein LOC132315594 [Cornus florida]XP_059669904.1 uncharacterized protein LOC132315594 [Cornus florida]
MDGKNVGELCSPCKEDVDTEHCKVDFTLEQESHSPDIANVDVEQSTLFAEEDLKIDELPSVGMEFESEEDSYVFYNRYASVVGFSVRKDFLNKSKVNGAVVSRRFTCFKEGFRRKDKRDVHVKKPRKQTRTGCLAQMTISRQPNGKYRIIHFEANHNHDVVSPHLVHMLPSQRRLAFAQAVEADFRVQEDLKLASSSRYKDMCLNVIKISARAAKSGEAFQFAVEQFDKVIQEVEKMMNVKPADESQICKHGASDSESKCVAKSVHNDAAQHNIFAGSMKFSEDLQAPVSNTISSIPCLTPAYCSVQLPTPSLVPQGLDGVGTNPLISFTYEAPNLAMCQQSDYSFYHQSNASQHGFLSHMHLPTMDSEDQHTQSP